MGQGKGTVFEAEANNHKDLTEKPVEAPTSSSLFGKYKFVIFFTWALPSWKKIFANFMKRFIKICLVFVELFREIVLIS